jgi:hypothetical protein
MHPDVVVLAPSILKSLAVGRKAVVPSEAENVCGARPHDASSLMLNRIIAFRSGSKTSNLTTVPQPTYVTISA